MNKFLTKIATLSVGLAMAIGVGVAVGSGSRDVAKVSAATTTDTITASDLNATGTSYVAFEVAKTATYIGNSAKNSTNMQFNNNGTPKNRCIATSVSGGYIRSVSVTYGNANGKTMTVYVSNSAYSMSAAFNTGTSKGTLSSSNTTVSISGDFTHVALFPSGATYPASISFVWEPASTQLATPSPSYNDTTKKVSWADVEHASSYQVKVDNGSYATATSPYDVSGLTTGVSHTVYVVAKGTGSYTDSEAGSTTFTPTAPKTVSSISLSGTYPTTFEEGDEFSHTGMTVTAHYSDSTTGDVTSVATWSGYNMSQTGNQTVTVSYGGKSTTYSITVTEKVIDYYELIKSTDDLTDGASYLIGNVAGTAFMSTTQRDNNRGKQDPDTAASNDVVEYTEGFEVLTLGGEEGAWTLYATNPEGNASGATGYLYAASSSSNYLRTQAQNNANGEWSIAIDSDGSATILAQGSNTRNKMRYNSGNNPPIFSCYASDSSTGSVPALWKLIDTSESIALNKDSVSDMKGNTNQEIHITASNFTPTTISATYSVANIASITAGNISDGIIPLNISCTGVGTTVATITVNGGNETHTIDLSITVAQKPASLTLVNANISHGEIEVKHGASRQVTFTALDTDEDDYPIDYSGITASSSNTNVRLTGSTSMVLNGDAVGDAVVTCTITATAGWQTPITQTLTVHVIDDYNEKNVSISVINGVNVDQGDELVIADHISSATATTHFGTNNNPIADDELLFSYTNNRSAAVSASNFVWDVTDPNLDAGETETRTVYVFVTFNDGYAGTSFTAVIEVEDRSVVGLKVDGVSKDNGDDIDLELARNSTYNFTEHVTVDPVNATESHTVNYAVEAGGEYVSLSNGVMTVGSKTGETVACISATPAALDSFTIYFWVSITREAMTITADMPESWSQASSLSVGDHIAIVYENGETLKQLSEVTSNIGQVENYSTAGEPSSDYIFTVGQGNAEGSYTFYNGSYYLAYTNTSTSSNNNLYTIANPASNDQLNQVSWTVSFDNVDSVVITNVYNTNRKLQYNTNSPRFCGYTGTQVNGKIYKLAGGTSEVTVSDALFNVVNGAMSLKSGSTTLYDLGLCNASGTSFNVSAWNTLGSSFTSSIISDNKLAYARANENGNEIEQFLAVYDYVIGKKESGYTAYASANDYLGRVASGKISASAHISPLLARNNNAGTIAAIVIISLVSVAGVGGYFFLRKKKED